MNQHMHKNKNQNEHILATSADAHRCAMKLKEDGFSVLSIHIESRNPVVWIQLCNKCNKLRGATKVKCNTPEGMQTTMAVSLHGCQVQWIIRG